MVNHKQIPQRSKKKEAKETVQSAGKEEDKQIGIIASIALDILVDPQPSLRRRRRERVGIAKSNKGVGPGRRVADEVLSRELGEGVESEEGEEGDEVREEGDEETGGGCRSGVGIAGGGRGGSGGGGGGALVENFEVATVAEPGLEGGLGNAES